MRNKTILIGLIAALALGGSGCGRRAGVRAAVIPPSSAGVDFSYFYDQLSPYGR